MGVPRSVPVPVISPRQKVRIPARHQLCQRTFATAVVTKDGDHPRFDIVKVITEPEDVLSVSGNNGTVLT